MFKGSNVFINMGSWDFPGDPAVKIYLSMQRMQEDSACPRAIKLMLYNC